MRHELTEERCLVMHRNGETCRRCSRCGQWIGAVFSPDGDCPGPPAAVAPEAREPDHCTRCDALGYRDRTCHLCGGSGFVELPVEAHEVRR